jgi:hypothetical protein
MAGQALYGVVQGFDWSEDRDFIQQRLGLAILIDLIQAKPNDVLSNRGITHECTRGADARALSVLPGHVSGWHK